MDRLASDNLDRRRRRAGAAVLGGILILGLVIAGALLMDDRSETGAADLRRRGEGAAEIEDAPATPIEALPEAAAKNEDPPPILAVPVAAEAGSGETVVETAARSDPKPTPPTVPTVPTVLVSVYDAVTKRPVAGAGVARVANPLAPYRPDLEPSATTGADGTVLLQEGQCYVVMPAGYAARFLDLREPPKAKIIVEVHRAVAFTGQVIDERGIPMPGIAVQAGAITRLDRGSGSEADRHATPACDAGRWMVSITDHGGNFVIAGIPAGQVFVEILDDRWFFRDPPPIRMPVLPGQDPPRVLIELAPVTVAAVVVRAVPAGTPVAIDLELPSVPPSSKEPLPPDSFEARRGLFKDLQRRVLRDLASAGFPKEGTDFRAGVLAARASDGFFKPMVKISLPGAPGLPMKVPIRTETVDRFDPAQATVVDLTGVDLGRLVPVRLRFRDAQGRPATWVPPLRLTSGVIPRAHRLPDAAAAAESGVVTLHLPPGVWDLKPDTDAPWREPWSFKPLKLHVAETEVDLEVVLDLTVSVIELTLADPYGRLLRGFNLKETVTTAAWDPDRGHFALLNSSGNRTLHAFNGRRWITATIPQHRLRPGRRSKIHLATSDPHEF